MRAALSPGAALAPARSEGGEQQPELQGEQWSGEDLGDQARD